MIPFDYAVSKEIGKLMGQGKREEAEVMKQQVAEIAAQLEELKHREEVLPEEIRQRMLVIPNIIDESVPLGKDDSENVQIECFGEMALVAIVKPSGMKTSLVV